MGIELKNITYSYSLDTVYETKALSDISLSIGDGEFIGIIGASGSGKSTLAMHLNGLLKASSGDIFYNGERIYDKNYYLKGLRTQVGLVFQYPEHQLFESSVVADVKFGPLNQGLSDKEAAIRAYEALEILSFPRELHESSPHMISGGQKRLAAIAGVLAMKPAVMILDEPTAGLDPKSKIHMLDTLRNLHQNTGRTIILISHSMEDVAEYVERIIVLNRGRVIFDDKPASVFSHIEELEKMDLSAPAVSYLVRGLRESGFELSSDIIKTDDAVREILRCFEI